MAKLLETRRERVRRLIDIAIADGNTVAMYRGYYLLSEINKRLSQCYSLNNRFSNLF